MKATIEIPDDLYRRVKAKSAMEGRTVRAVAVELFQRWTEAAESGEASFVSSYDAMEDFCGIVDSGIPDLATNPKHMEGFGSDKKGDR